MDITARDYMIGIKTLNAAKIQEKIREDIFVTFEDRIYAEGTSSEMSKPDPFKRVVSIGSTVAGEMKSRAALALFFACLAIIIYIWFRFGELKFGVSAVLTLVHDVLITVGAVAIADHYGNIFGDVKLNLPMVAAFLTLIGYSLNDTIVLFDRIRENLTGKDRTITKDLIDHSINQNLNRTLLTSLTTFGVVSALYFVGGAAIHGFAFVMMIGVVVGTYSSIFIASPILLDWEFVKKVFKIIIICIFFPIWITYKLLHKTPPVQNEKKLKPSRA
jgi:preprotein translocase SecF subunit